VDRDADGPRLVRHGTRDRLPDPPGGVGGELVTLGVVELLDRADQAEIALLDQVQEQHAAAHVPFGDRHHEPQVRLDEALFGPGALPDELPEFRESQTGDSVAELVLGEQAGFDRLGELHLLFGCQQRHTADLPQVDPDQITGRRPLAYVFLLGAGRLLVALRLEHLHTVLGEHPHDAFQRVGRQLGSVKRGSDVIDGYASALPSLCDEVRHLINGWRSTWQHRCTHGRQSAVLVP
jgi:hypothetical protein